MDVMQHTQSEGTKVLRRRGIMADESAVPAAEARLAAYNRRTGRPLLMLAFGFLVVYAIPILWPGASAGLLLICEAVSYVIWLVFVADLVIRIYLAEHRWSYIGGHPVDLLVVALPALRPLRILRVFTAGQVILTRGKEFAIGRTLAAAAGAGALITFIAALAELDAERGHAGANIETFREAIWWAGVTITTVGYGDYYPVTAVGQAVAFALMIVGISLLGLVTATVAAWFLTKVRAPAARGQEAVMTDLRELKKEVAALSRAVANGWGPPVERPLERSRAADTTRGTAINDSRSLAGLADSLRVPVYKRVADIAASNGVGVSSKRQQRSQSLVAEGEELG